MEPDALVYSVNEWLELIMSVILALVVVGGMIAWIVFGAKMMRKDDQP